MLLSVFVRSGRLSQSYESSEFRCRLCCADAVAESVRHPIQYTEHRLEWCAGFVDSAGVSASKRPMNAVQQAFIAIVALCFLAAGFTLCMLDILDTPDQDAPYQAVTDKWLFGIGLLVVGIVIGVV